MADATVVTKTSTGSSTVPPVISVRQQKSTLSRKSKQVEDNFELVEYDELNEDFDVLSSEGPSASNGTAQPDLDVIMDGLDGAFRSLGEGV
jgi:hypothetical protein